MFLRVRIGRDQEVATYELNAAARQLLEFDYGPHTRKKPPLRRQQQGKSKEKLRHLRKRLQNRKKRSFVGDESEALRKKPMFEAFETLQQAGYQQLIIGSDSQALSSRIVHSLL